MGRKLALGFAALLAIALAFVALQPSAFTVSRSLVIAAPPAVIYPQIADLRAMNVWSPWAHMDPKLVMTYDGPAAGVGARSAWQSPQLGDGRMSIVAATPDRDVELKLELLGPMGATNRVRFHLEPVAQGTEVTWSMDGNNGFLGKAFSLFLDMDTMVGGVFADGLAALAKQVASAKASPQAG